MQWNVLGTLALVVTLAPAETQAQTAPKAATYITDEEVKTVNREPGIDHTLRVVDIGNEHFAVGIIHRGATAAAAGGRGAAAGASAPAGEPCGESTGAPPTSAASGITHDSQTEGYVIVSGGGTLVTGGHIVNGRKSPPDSDVTKILNGPSCSGAIVGADVVKRTVKVGDIVIIPAGVPHGWSDIPDHVDYLSLRPSDHVLEAGYVHPSIKK
jgi:mannose-6-phosphate isomerase-like protein (cupin superfamily)